MKRVHHLKLHREEFKSFISQNFIGTCIVIINKFNLISCTKLEKKSFVFVYTSAASKLLIPIHSVIQEYVFITIWHYT